MRDLTSFEGVFEGVCIVNFETFLSSTGKTALILVESYVQNLIFVVLHFWNIYLLLSLSLEIKD